jgi:hypothetical protein
VEKAPTRNRDAGIGLLRRASFPPARAWRVAAPPAPHALSRPSHVDHEDAVIVEVGAAQGRTGEPWPRAILQVTPDHHRLRLEGAVLVGRQQHMLLAATFVQLENLIARAMWVAVAPEIDGVVRQLPDQAGRRTQ